MKIIKIKSYYGKHAFLRTFLISEQGEPVMDWTNGQIIKDDSPSFIVRDQDSGQILKIIRARRAIEYIKQFWRHSRFNKEIKGNFLLKKIGIKVPNIYEAGVNPLPYHKQKFIGYYIMEDLGKKGFQDAKIALENNFLSSQARKRLFDLIVKDIKLMQENSVVFNDLKLTNIFCNKYGDITWIDTGVSVYPWYQSHKFIKKNNFALQRFVNRHEKQLSTEELSTFREL